MRIHGKWLTLSGCLIALLGAAGLLLIFWGVMGNAQAALLQGEASLPVQPAPTPQMEDRERESSPDVPEISFIDSPTAQCFRIEQHTDSCYIEWSYLNVSAATSAYIISMTVDIDGRLRAYHSGFFQSSMYVPYGMVSPGFGVACGKPGASGKPDLGNTYPYTIRARDTNGLKAANYGSITCPADVVPVASASLTGPGSGKTNVNYSFDITAAPITSTLPITFTWQATGYPSSMTVTNGLSSTRNFTWSTPGIKQVEVNVSNLGGSIDVMRTVTIEYHKVFLPLSRK